jgi:serine protease Do
MVATVNRIPAIGISVGQEVSALAERLRKSVVRVGGMDPGSGSGVIWSADGLIVTNAHVATNERLHAVLTDGRRLEAQLIARDPRRDLALLKVHASGLAALEPCDLSNLRAGEAVLALGYPMGGDAVTVGILHAAPRDAHWLTADIRVAPGNSGGPLCDVHGRLVGINTMVVDGLTLAISVRAIERFVARANAGQQTRSAAAD